MGAVPATTERAHGGQLAITPAKSARLLAAIAGGNYINVSCQYAGITTPTYRNWINIAEREVEALRITGADPETIISTWLDAQPPITYAPSWPGFSNPGPAQLSPIYWPCVLFAYLLEKAQAEAEVEMLTRIRIAAKAPNHWQAAAWMLERKNPDRWGRRERVQMEGVAGGAPIQVQQVPSTDDLVNRVIQLAARAASQNDAGQGQLTQ